MDQITATSIEGLIGSIKYRYVNAESQLSQGDSWLDFFYGRNGIFLFLSTDNSTYSPFRLSKSGDLYEVKPIVFVHGISGHKKNSHIRANQFQDLKDIIKGGFKSRIGEMYDENTLLLDPCNSGNYADSLDWAYNSRDEHTFGDRYLIEANTVKSKNGKIPEPTDSKAHAVYIINPNQIRPIIVLDSDLSQPILDQQVAFYENEIPNKYLKFVVPCP